MKIAKITLWTLAFLVLLAGAIVVIIEAASDASKIPGYITILSSAIVFIAAFMIDAINTMIYKPTAGDAYSLMTTEELMRVLMARGVKYAEKKPRAYYLTLCRETEGEVKNG